MSSALHLPSLEASVGMSAERQRDLNFYPTPTWAAEALVSQFFPDLSSSDLVIEPTAGSGAFLLGIPAHVPAFGVELDPGLAEVARARTGRTVHVGDIRTIEIEERPTVALGNPPFSNDFIEALLDRLHALLPEHGRAGLILGALAFGSSSRVARFNERWSIESYNLPRYLYPRLSNALSFGIFTKDTQRRLVGFALYNELEEVRRMHRSFQELLDGGRKGGPWRAVVRRGMELLGGRATTAQLDALIAPHSPQSNSHVRDKIRQELGLGPYIRHAPGDFELVA